MKLLVVTQIVDKNDPILGFFHRWLEEFAKYTTQLTVICLKEGEHDLPPHVKVLSLGKEKRRSRLMYIKRFYVYIWNYRQDYDAVFVHMNPIYVVLAGLFWKIKNVPVYLWYTHRNVDLKLRIADFFSKKIFSASVKSLRLETSKKIALGHGIDTHVFTPQNVVKEYDLITVGRISLIKRIEILIKLVEQIKRNGQEVKALVVGLPIMEPEQAYYDSLKKQVRDKGLDKNIIFYGPANPALLPSVYVTAKILGNFTDIGSYDKVVLEAMACGVLPIVANAAFKEELSPYGLFIDDAENMDQVMNAWHAAQGLENNDEVKKQLRDIVVREHSLQALIKNLISEIKS